MWRLAVGLVLVVSIVRYVTQDTAITYRRLPLDQRLSVYTVNGALQASTGMRRWTADLGVTAPVLVNGVLYTMTAPPAPIPTTLTVHAVRARDGTTLWSVPQPTGAGVGPLAVNGTLVVVPTLQNGMGRLTALDAADGHVVWRTAPLPMVQPHPTDIAGPFIPLLASFISPLAFGSGYVLALASSTDSEQSSSAFAWNLTDGSLAWQVALPGANAYAGRAGTLAATGTTVTIAYSAMTLGSGSAALLGLDLATGAQRWPQVRAAGLIDASSAAVVVLADTHSYETISGVRPSDGTTLWQWQPPPAPFGHFTFDVVAISDTALVFRTLDYEAHTINVLSPQSVTPHLYAVSKADGTLLWQRVLATTVPYSGSFGFTGNGAVYYKYDVVQAEQDHLTLLALDALTGLLQWQRTTDGGFG
jgi:outer membrane protein assembly factor BamB